MNYTRSISVQMLLEKLCLLNADSIRDNKEVILEYLLNEINLIYANQDGGFWELSESDKIYIDFLEQIKFVVVNSSEQERLKEILDDACRLSSDKLKVLFLASDISVWPSIETVYGATLEDERFVVDTIDLPINFDKQYEKSSDFYADHKNAGHEIIRYQDYDLASESPDVAIYSKPYGGGNIVPPQFYVSDLRKIVQRMVLVPYAFFDLADNDFYIYNGYHFPLHYFAWKWIGYSQKFKKNAERLGFAAGENVQVSGHPKFDQIYNLKNYSSDLMDEYKSIIAGRKVLLYNSHHKMGTEPTDSGAFPEYYDQLFKYFEEHQDVVLIWRPHPFFMVTAQEFFSKSKLGKIVARVEEAENIIIDTSDNYLMGFALSDAIITDGATSMAFEYAATGNPVYYTKKPDGGFVMPEDSVADIWYWVESPEELPEYLEQFRNGLDPMQEYRNSRLEELIGKVDGKCGIRIKDSIIDDLVKEEEKKIETLFSKIITRDKKDCTFIEVCCGETNDKNHPLLTALVINYNNYKFIFETIDSILEQDYPNFELIISDDASEYFDIFEIQKYIEAHKTNNLKRYCLNVNKTNVGTVKHLEIIRVYSKGEYEMNIASDDVYASNTVFSTMMDAAQVEYAGAEWLISQVDMCDCGLNNSRGYFVEQEVIDLIRHKNYKGLQEINVSTCVLPAAGSMYKRSYFEKVGSISGLYSLIEDYTTSVRALRMGIPVYYVDEVTIKHREGGVSHGNSARRQDKYAQYVEDFVVCFEEEVYPFRDQISKSSYKKSVEKYKRNLRNYDWHKWYIPKKFRKNEDHPFRQEMRKML